MLGKAADSHVLSGVVREIKMTSDWLRCKALCQVLEHVDLDVDEDPGLSLANTINKCRINRSEAVQRRATKLISRSNLNILLG